MNPTHPADVEAIKREAAILVGRAEALGVTLRIDSTRKPLDQGNPGHVIDAWASRRGSPQKPPCGGRDYCGRFPFCGCGDIEPLPGRDPSKPATQQGLFRKFNISRTDGSDAPGKKHSRCEYFVLDVGCDQHAKQALAAYAAAVEATHPDLAADMRQRYELQATRWMPDWMHYNALTEVLTIRGKKYSAPMFGEKGFLGTPGTLLQIVQGSDDLVTLKTLSGEFLKDGYRLLFAIGRMENYAFSSGFDRYLKDHGCGRDIIDSARSYVDLKFAEEAGS